MTNCPEIGEFNEFEHFVFEQAAVGVAIINSDTGKFERINNKYCTICGYSKDEMLNMDFMTITHPDDLDLDLGKMELLKKGEIHEFSIDKRYFKKDNSMIWIRLTVSPLIKVNNVLQSHIAVVEDITERKQIELALKDRESLLRRTEKIAHVGSWDWDITTDTVYWSDELFRIFKMDPENGVPSFHGDHKKLYTEESWLVLKNAVEQLIEKGTMYELDLDIVRGNGEIGHCFVCGYSKKDNQGKVVGLYGSVQDITVRKRLEKAREQEKYFLEEAQDIGNIGTWDLDIKTNVLLWTPQNYKIFGVKKGTALTYKSFLECVHPDDRDYVNNKWMEGVAGKPYNIEHRLLVNGKVKWVREKAKLFINDAGEVYKAIGVTQDITDKKHHEMQLKTALEAKNVLLKEVHHRVKNNLQMIKSLLYQQQYISKDERIKSILQDSINRILSMAVIHEQIYQSQDLKNINIKKYLDDITRTLSLSYRKPGKTIRLETQSDELFFSLDKAIPLALIINELVSNAYKYAFVGKNTGLITVELVKHENDSVTLMIGDDGIGLPDDFDINEVETLGLQIVYNISTRELKGSLEIKSSQNKGTHYIITI